MSDGMDVTLYGLSDWHRSMGDAEQECDDRLRELEADALRQAESDGWQYIGGETSGYDREHDAGADLYRCGAERVLLFLKGEDDLVVLDADVASMKHVNFESPPPIDITGQLLAALDGKIPAQVEKVVRTPDIRINGTGVSVRPSRRMKIRCKLKTISFKSLSVVASDLALGKDIQTVNIPSYESIHRIPYDNCGSPEQSFVRDYTTKIVRGWRLKTTRRITSSTKIEGNLKFTSAEASVSHEIKRELSTEREYSETKEETLRLTLPFKVAANSKVDIEIRVMSLEARRSFEGPVTVDGIAIAHYEENEKREHRLSDLLSEEDRSFELSGFYSNIDYEEMPIKVVATPCG